jgi:ribose transport system substrate-binding protein
VAVARNCKGVVVIAVGSLSLAVLTAACGDAKRVGSAERPIADSQPLGDTRGPHGEAATPTSALDLTPADIARMRAARHTVALVWHENSDFTRAVTAGARAMFGRLGIEVVSESEADFDAAKQKANVETALARRPSAMLALPVDPTILAPAFKAVARQGTKLVLLSVVPDGMKQGEDYVNVVTDDLFEMGRRAADALAAAVGGKGKIAYFFRDNDSYVTNQRDAAFLKTISTTYPDIDVVAKVGIADPDQAQEQANGVLVREHDLDGVYVTFAQPPGEGVLAALRANGNTKTHLVTLDLSEPMALDLANGGNTFALVADRAYEIGDAMAKSVAYGLLDKEAPPFVVVPAMTITRSNLAAGYRASLHRDPPASVAEALGR